MTTVEPTRTTGADHRTRLRGAAVVFLAAVVLHGADHVARGIDVVTGVVLGAGSLQFVVGLVAVLLVFRDHPLAADLAIVVGFGSAIGFTAAHLLPQWSALSDPYVGASVAPGVTWFSWGSALAEISADTALGVVGVRARSAATQT